MTAIVPMVITNETNHQEVFDFVLNAIVKQGKKSTGVTGSCLYRGRDNTACGIGHLLTDIESTIFEGKCVDHFYISIERFSTFSGGFLQRLQDCHDYAVGDRNFVSHYLAKMRELATDYDLKYNPPQ